MSKVNIVHFLIPPSPLIVIFTDPINSIVSSTVLDIQLPSLVCFSMLLYLVFHKKIYFHRKHILQYHQDQEILIHGEPQSYLNY